MTSHVAPKKFWALMLVDSITLLNGESDRLTFAWRVLHRLRSYVMDDRSPSCCLGSKYAGTHALLAGDCPSC
jgi:uncharacterized protein YbbK (DUF523 family)